MSAGIVNPDFTGWSWDTDYNQKLTSASINGMILEGFAEGTPIRFNHDGGEVSKTQGADGPGINRATPQGATIEIDLREDSPSNFVLNDMIRNQVAGGPSLTMVLYTGCQVTFTGKVQISVPGQLATGGPQMGSMTYTFVTKETWLYKGI